jgi:hypothetical protein
MIVGADESVGAEESDDDEESVGDEGADGLDGADEGGADGLVVVGVGVVLIPTPTRMGLVGGAATPAVALALALVDRASDGKTAACGLGAETLADDDAGDGESDELPSSPAAGGFTIATMAPTPPGCGRVGQRYGLEARLTAVTAAVASTPIAISREFGTLRRQAAIRRHGVASTSGSGSSSLRTISCHSGPA